MFREKLVEVNGREVGTGSNLLGPNPKSDLSAFPGPLRWSWRKNLSPLRILLLLGSHTR